MKKYVQRIKNNTDEYETPIEIFEGLDEEFHFTLDPCATDQNHKCQMYFTKDQDGLLQDWGGAERVLQSTV